MTHEYPGSSDQFSYGCSCQAVRRLAHEVLCGGDDPVRRPDAFSACWRACSTCYPELRSTTVLDFSVNRMVHINAMVVWMLYGFIGSAYWLVEEEAGVPSWSALGLANIRFLGADQLRSLSLFWSISSCRPARVRSSQYLVHQRRPRVHRGPALGRHRHRRLRAGVLLQHRGDVHERPVEWHISGVLVLDLIALAGLYLAGMFYTTNVSSISTGGGGLFTSGSRRPGKSWSVASWPGV